MFVSVTSTGELYSERMLEYLDEWIVKHEQAEDCEECTNNIQKILTAVIILGCSCLFVSAVLGAVALARNQLGKKRVTKGPYKVLLTATDFVFPQIADSRRVDEGIEAMLCCWLQQLQEFGGPEVEKPDLLLGSGGASMRTPARTGSSPNLAKQLIVDPRVRYNDVLQQDDIKLDWSFRLSLLTDLVRVSDFCVRPSEFYVPIPGLRDSLAWDSRILLEEESFETCVEVFPLYSRGPILMFCVDGKFLK
ncbi:unnamed protein product [Phaedon cochleariae]|uniref:Uncharacterized protein n=1 Tax=Phaedon cochleariae TaxID=80249 RepID=A0A9N9SC87_PHACE|nr:unnamed protein product [Phaedon cochleariae]